MNPATARNELNSQLQLEQAVQEAEEQRRRGDVAAALNSYKTILTKRLLDHQPDQPAVQSLKAADLIVMERLAELSLLFGHSEAADNLLNGMAGLCGQAGNAYGADYATLRRIYLAVSLGQLDKALNLLQKLTKTLRDWQKLPFSPQALKEWEIKRYWPNTDEAGRVVLLVYFYSVVGLLFLAQGQYKRGQFLLEQALVLSHEPNSPDLVKRMKTPLGLALARSWLEKGNLTAAEQELNKLEIDELKQPGFKIQWLEMRGKANLLRGDFGAALNYITQTLNLCRNRRFSQAELKARLNVAHIKTYLNQTAEARLILSYVREHARALKDEPLEARATALLSLAQTRGQSMVGGIPIAPSVSEMWSRPKGAAAPSKQEPTNFNIPQAGSYLAYFEDQSLTFYWYLGHGELATAATLLKKIKENFNESDSELIQIRLQILAGVLAYYQEQIKTAEALLSQARQSLQALGLIPELWQLQRFLRWCWARLDYPAPKLYSLTRETEGLLESMTASLDTADQVIFLLNKWEPDEEYIASEIDQLVRLKRRVEQGFYPFRLWWRWQMMDRLHHLMAHIDRYKNSRTKKTISGHEEAIKRVEAPTLWQRLRNYPKHKCTLSFLVLPDRVFIIQAKRFSLDFSVSPTTRIQVREWVRRWHELAAWSFGQRPSRALYFVDEAATAALPQEKIAEEARRESTVVAQVLAEGLQIPQLLKTLSPDTHSVTLIPDDSLHGFPFAAINYEGQSLIEKYALSVAFEHQIRPIAPIQGQLLNFTLIGVSHGKGQIQPLPGVLAELGKVEYWLSHRQNAGGKIQLCKLLDHEADKQTIIGQMQRTNLLHLACHGIFERNQPDASGFVLIPKLDQEPEILSLRELDKTDLTALNHATLSACWSADHFILPGRWIISLPETMWRAGAHSILGSLWAVDDRVAVSFMLQFYKNLENLSRAEALRQTQLDCLNDRLPGCEGMNTSNPFYWAGYTLYGEANRLEL